MPVIKSAIKKLRQSRKHAQRNKAQKEGIKTLITSFRQKPEKKILPKLMSLLDKAVKNKLFHRNKAARLKSRLAKLLKK